MVSNPNFYEYLSHPLLLIIVGAIITGYLIPYITRRWQNHQKALELKTSLVREINEYLISMLTKIQVTEVARIGPENHFQQRSKEMQEYYIEWLVKKTIIGGHIRAFFPKEKEMISNWNDLTNATHHLEGLSEININEQKRRKEYMQNIQHELSENFKCENWVKLANRFPNKSFWENWNHVKYLIENQNIKLIQKIINTPISAFN